MTVILTSILLVLQTVRSADICHSNQIEALFAKSITHPWLPYIASSTEYDANWLGWDDTTTEAEAYAEFSRYITLSIWNQERNSIREYYRKLDTDNLQDAQRYLGIKFDQRPSTIDEQSWNTVDERLNAELMKLIALSEWKDQVSLYLGGMGEQQKSIINEVSLYIEANNEVPVYYVTSTDSNSWSVAGEVFNSFASLFGIFGGGIINDAIQLTAWGISSTQSLGDAVISNQNEGTSYSTGVNWNNAELSTSSNLLKEIDSVYNTSIHDLATDVSAIANNAGKLAKFWECHAIISNITMSLSGTVSDAMLETKSKIVPYQTIMIWKLLLPAKYTFQAQYSCSNYISDDSSDCHCSSDVGPPCDYLSVAYNARTTELHIHGKWDDGYVVAFLGADQSTSSAIVAGTISQFETDLATYVGNDEWTLKHILDSTMENVHDFTEMLPSKFPGSVSVSVNSELTFSFKAQLNGWCMYECHPYDATEECGATHGDWEKGCKYCSDGNKDGTYDQYCATSGGSCLSSTTQVLMADDSYKQISDIVVGDSVKNPLTATGQTVQVISAPLRNGRKLYSVNGLGFKFTRAHRFFLYGLNGSVGAIDKDAVLFYIPSLDETMVEYLNANVSLARFNVSLERVGRFDLSEHYFNQTTDSANELLYDLVFDLTSPSMYVVNGGIVVSNEWWDFQAYPKSAYVILGMLHSLVQSENHTLHRLSTQLDKSSAMVNQVIGSVARHRTPFNNIISAHASDVWSNVNASDIGEVCEAFVLEADEGSGAVNVLFDSDLWAIGKALEEFIARIGPQLNTILYSQQFSHICFDDIDYALLIQDLVAEMKDLMSDLEYLLESDAISTTEIIAASQAITTDQPQEDVAATLPCFVCLFGVVLHVLFG
eukprot:30574_1